MRICKSKDCHNIVSEGEKYCKYHLVKKAQVNKNILLGIVTMVGSGILILDKLRRKKN